MIAHVHHNPLCELLDGIVDAVRVAGPIGCPGGFLYAALSSHGCSLDTFETIMTALVSEAKLTKRGDLYFVRLDDCPTCKVRLVYYDGALGYSSFKCPQCHFDINDAKRADEMHSAAIARAAQPGYDPEHEHHKAIANRVARCSQNKEGADQ